MNHPLVWPTVEEGREIRLREVEEACDVCEAVSNDDEASPLDILIALHRVVEAFDRLPGPMIEELS